MIRVLLPAALLAALLFLYRRPHPSSPQPKERRYVELCRLPSYGQIRNVYVRIADRQARTEAVITD